jgi:hypothetical protein
MLVSGRGSQDVQQIWASFNELPSFRGISVSRTLEGRLQEAAATSDPTKRFREYFKLNTITSSFVDFCPWREESTVEVH